MLLIKLLLQYLRPYWRSLMAVVVLQLLGAVALLYLPNLNANIVDYGVAAGNTTYILKTSVLMLVVTIGQMACSVPANYFGMRVSMAFGRDLRAALFRHAMSFSARELVKFGAPSLITRNMNDVQQIEQLVAMSSTVIVTAPIIGIGATIMAIHENRGLSWLIWVSVPALAGTIGMITHRMVPLFRRMQTCLDSVNRILREQIGGVRVVRAFVREPLERQRFQGANVELTDASLQVGRLMALLVTSLFLVLNMSSAALLWFGAIRISAGETQIGTLTALLVYLAEILMSVMMGAFMLVLIPRATVCADRICEVLETDTSLAPPRTVIRSVAAHPEVEFRSVTFWYRGAVEPVLREVSFKVKSGQTVAVIGSTGAGKTTLISLVPRMLDATSGTVLVGGVDVRELDPERLRAHIGFVPQTSYLFSGTVASNLRYGNSHATEEELWEALEVAQARDFVQSMQGELDASIAQGGRNLSGGQRQRLAIARALVRKPAIYLFDDSFSGLDLRTAAQVRAALTPFTRHAAVILVAQVVSMIVDADLIAVLDKGSLVGLGGHRELLHCCPTYAEIAASQRSRG